MTATARPPAGADVEAASVAQATANAALARLVVEELRGAGVRWVVASPGGRNIPLLLALEACGGLQVVSVVDERQAGFVALGIAKATRLPVATVATSGSAVAHYLPAVVEASEDDVPWIVISADRPAELHGNGAPQTTTQVGLLAPAARCSAHVDAPETTGVSAEARLQLRRTFGAATAQRPGPVHLNVAFREPLWHPDVAREAPLQRLIRSTMAEEELPPDVAERLARQLTEARRGLIVCGPAVGLEDAAEPILALAHRLGWPVIADSTSNLRYRCGSVATLIAAHEVLAKSELASHLRPEFILRFGREPVARSSWEWLRDLGQDTPRLHVEANGRSFDPFGKATEIVACDPARFAKTMLASLGDEHDTEPAWLSTWSRLETAAQRVLTRQTAGPLTEAAVARAVTAGVPVDTCLFAGNSMPIRDLDLFGAHRDAPLRVIGNRGINGIDGAIATCVGLALGGTQPATVGLIGDVTALHDIGALVIAAGLERGLTFVVVDNNGGRIFEHLPVSSHPDRDWFERRLATAPSQDIDLTTIARGYGVRVRQVETVSAFEAAIAEEAAHSTTSFIVAKVDPSVSVATRRSAIAEATRMVARAAQEGAL